MNATKTLALLNLPGLDLFSVVDAHLITSDFLLRIYNKFTNHLSSVTNLLEKGPGQLMRTTGSGPFYINKESSDFINCHGNYHRKEEMGMENLNTFNSCLDPVF